jgi:hypothetical protein
VRAVSDRADELHAELAALLVLHEPGLSDAERAELLRLEEHREWRPGRRPARPEPKVRDFLDLFDRAEQEELTYRSLPEGSVDGLRRAFRTGLDRAQDGADGALDP